MLIEEADPEAIEEWKRRNMPVWSHAGILCTGETSKNVMKITFAQGAVLKDALGRFNSNLGGNVRRAIGVHDGDKLDEDAFKALVRAVPALEHVGASRSPCLLSKKTKYRLSCS